MVKLIEKKNVCVDFTAETLEAAEKEAAIGLKIAQLLNLHTHKGVYWTAEGIKSDLGLYRTVKRIIEEGE
jgi:hypothetical protein